MNTSLLVAFGRKLLQEEKVWKPSLRRATEGKSTSQNKKTSSTKNICERFVDLHLQNNLNSIFEEHLNKIPKSTSITEVNR